MLVPRIVAFAIAVVLLVATGVAAVAGFSDDADDRAVTRTDVRRAALGVLATEVDDLVATTQQLSQFFAASDEVTQRDFASFAAPLLHHGDASAVAWIDHVPGAQRGAWERRNGIRIREPGPGGLLVDALQHGDYDATLYYESAEPATLPRGIDVDVYPARRAALRTAAELGRPQSTGVVRLLGTGQPGIVVYSAVRRPDGTLQGAASGTFRVDRLTSAVAEVLPEGAAFELREGGRRVSGGGTLGDDVDSWAVDLAGRRWELRTTAPGVKGVGNGVIAIAVGGLLSVLVLLGNVLLGREARRARQAASRSEERFASAFEGAPVGMALLDATGRHVKVNATLAGMLGRTREEMLGQGPAIIMAPAEAAAAERLIAALARGDQQRFDGDTTMVTADGRRLCGNVHMSLLDGEPGGDAAILVHVVDVTEQRRAERRMRHLADHDPLTGLLNRRGFAAALAAQLAHTRRYDAGGTLLMLDLDGFKAVNDARGHDAGDALLVEVAQLLRGCLRETDVVARLGGDEFAVILPRETVDEATVVAAKLADRLREARLGAGDGVPGVTASIGVAAFEPTDETGDDAMREADLAMYAAKAAGRDRHAVHRRPADVV